MQAADNRPNLFKQFYRICIVPTYQILFILFVVWTVAGVIFYHSTPFVLAIVDWTYETWTGVDLAPQIAAIPNTSQQFIAGTAGLVIGLFFLFVRSILIQRRRWRHILAETRYCLEENLKFQQNIERMRESKSSSVRAVVSDIAREHLIVICTRISEIFEVLTRTKCHTSVKSFDRTNGTVATIARDALSHNRARGQSDEALQKFSYKENTAFRDILENPKRYMFRCNHLYLAALIGRYENTNPDWRKYYSATVVVPITLHRNQTEINEKTVVGFICVDNGATKFDKKTSRALLLIFVVLVHGIMLTLGWTSEPKGADNA